MSAPRRLSPAEEYRALDAVNWSSLCHLRDSPKHYRFRKSAPREETDAMRLGTLTHAAVFEPDRLPKDFAVWTGGTRRGPEWTAFERANAGRTIVTESQYDRALAIRDAVRADPIARGYLKAGEPEKVLTWTDATTGLRCKGKLDWFNGYAVVDLKTLRSTETRMATQSAARFGTWNQLAFYRAGVIANDLAVDPLIVVIAVEQEGPHDVAVYRPETDWLNRAEEENAELLALLKHCIDTDTWPGRFSAEQTMALPAYLKDDIEFIDNED